MSAPTPETADTSDAARASLEALRTEIAKAVVGQDPAVTGLVVALLCRGHVLLEGVPGVAKTLLVRALAASLELDTKRVQFTPDLMPSDVTGSLVYDARTSEFSFQPGPVFTNLLLADEINSHPSQDPVVSAGGDGGTSGHRRRRAPPAAGAVPRRRDTEPGRVRGHVSLPEAQLDRFLVKLTVPLPARDDEINVLMRHAEGFNPRDLKAAGVQPAAGPLTWKQRAARSLPPPSPPKSPATWSISAVPPVNPLTHSRRLTPRRHRPALHRTRLGLAHRPRLRHPRRRQAPWPCPRSATASSSARRRRWSGVTADSVINARSSPRPLRPR